MTVSKMIYDFWNRKKIAYDIKKIEYQQKLLLCKFCHSKKQRMFTHFNEFGTCSFWCDCGRLSIDYTQDIIVKN